MPAMGDLVLMSKDGNTELYRNYSVFNTSITIQDEIDKFVSAGINVTAVSATVGGPAIDPTSSVMDYVGSGEGLTLYDATSEPETITGFYLDGKEYVLGSLEASGVTTEQPSNPVAGSTYYDTTNNVIKVYNGTAWEEVGGGNVIAITQAEYEALPEATKNDGKLRIITDAPAIDVGNVSSTDVTTIVVSTSAPASGTASNIITIVTD